MERPPGIKWLFMDLNSYFASVEQQINPHLRGKPVAVVPTNTDYTCAIAASYEAKLYGIKTGTMIKEAKKLCPHLHCIQAQHQHYVAYHNRIIEEVVKHTPINKIWSIDELSSRLPPAKRNIESAKIIAQNIKQGIWQNVGEAINCSVGFAPNSLLAKIACEMQKPNGLTIIQQEDLPYAILHLKLTDLPGIGRNMEKRLRAANINTVENLWNTSPKQARRIWRSVQGERFWYQLHGYDIENPATKPSVIGHSRVLDPNLRAPDKARLITRKLAAKAAQRLRSKDLFARKITLSCRTKDGYRTYAEHSINATNNQFDILPHIDELWRTMMQKLTPIYGAQMHKLQIKKVSITLHHFIDHGNITDDLFAHKNEICEHKKHANTSLDLALLKLQKKYKKDVVTMGMTPQTSAGDVGTKIAFSRVPEQEEFWT